MATIKIPSGKILRLNLGGVRVTGNIPIVLEEDITLSLSSSFSPLIGGGASNKLITMLGALSKDILGYGFSGQFKQMGFQVWTGTDPLGFSAQVGFYMGSTNLNDAKVEVYDPAIALMKLPLPDDSGSHDGIGLIAPGPSLLNILQKTKVGSLVGSHVPKAGAKMISMQIGKILRVNSVIVKKAEPTFAIETDSNGYPIWAKISLDISSTVTATVQLLQTTIKP